MNQRYSGFQCRCARCGHRWHLMIETAKPLSRSWEEIFDAMESGVCERCGDTHFACQMRFAAPPPVAKEVSHG